MLADDIGAARTRAARKAVEQKGLCIFILPRLDVRRCNASNVVNADYKLRLCNPTVMARRKRGLAFRRLPQAKFKYVARCRFRTPALPAPREGLGNPSPSLHGSLRTSATYT